MSWLDEVACHWSTVHRVSDRTEAPWFDACEDRPGVYRLIALQDGAALQPATLDRVCGRDRAGTLYIGAAPRSLTGRVGQLVRYHHPDFKGGSYAALPLVLERAFPADRLGVCWSYAEEGADVFATERALLTAYTEALGERPPLNSLGGSAMADEERIARVARALCVAGGLDPEEAVYLRAEDVEAGESDQGHEALAPVWTTYAGEARRMIAAVRAIGLLE